MKEQTLSPNTQQKRKDLEKKELKLRREKGDASLVQVITTTFDKNLHLERR